MSNQHDAIIARLLTGARITGLDALKDASIGSMKLSTRIGEIRREYGIPVEMRFIKTESGKSVCEYWLTAETIERLGYSQKVTAGSDGQMSLDIPKPKEEYRRPW